MCGHVKRAAGALMTRLKDAVSYGCHFSEDVYTRKIPFVPPIGERLNTHSDFCGVLAADLSTRHSWRDINLDDVYTHIYFSESTRPRLSGSEQSAQQTMNEFTLFVDICLIPLSNTCSFDVAAKDL